MLMDVRSQFAAAGTAIPTAAAGSDAVFGDVIDLIPGDKAVYGIAQTTEMFGCSTDDLYLVIGIDTVVAPTTNDISFKLVSADNAALTTNPVIHFSTGSVLKSALVAGYRVCAIQLPRGTYKKYLGVMSNAGTSAVTSGKGFAFITTDPTAWVAAPDGV